MTHRSPRPQSQHGFTLLEALVVLVITSLISLVLIQGLGAVLNMRASFGDKMVDLDQAVIKRSMVETPLKGLVADFVDGESIFAGNAQRLSGLTLSPLTRRPGRATPFVLELQYNEEDKTNLLVYREERDQPIILTEWDGDRASFTYLGDDRGWLPEWPSEGPQVGPGNVIADVRPPQLPELIYLQTNSALEPDFAVAVMGRRNRVPRDPPILGS